MKKVSIAYKILYVLLGIFLLAIILWAAIPNAPFKNSVSNQDNSTTEPVINPPKVSSESDYEITSSTINNETVRFKIDEEKNYNIDISVGNVKIVPVSSKDMARIEITAPKALTDSVDTNLTLGEKYGIKISAKSLNSFRFDKIEIKIYLPEYKLNSIELNVGAGSVNMQNLEANEFILKATAGNVVVTNCEFNTMNTSLYAGNCEFYLGNDSKMVDLNVLAGQLKLFIPDSIDGFNMHYNVSAGNLTVDNGFTDNVQNNFIIGKTGTCTYKDGNTNITLNMTAGNVSVNKYNK